MKLRFCAHQMVPQNRRYVVKYVARDWVGKPDPAGLGRYEVWYSDPSVAHEAAMKLVLAGHKVSSISLETERR